MDWLCPSRTRQSNNIVLISSLNGVEPFDVARNLKSWIKQSDIYSLDQLIRNHPRTNALLPTTMSNLSWNMSQLTTPNLHVFVAYLTPDQLTRKLSTRASISTLAHMGTVLKGQLQSPNHSSIYFSTKDLNRIVGQLKKSLEKEGTIPTAAERESNLLHQHLSLLWGLSDPKVKGVYLTSRNPSIVFLPVNDEKHAAQILSKQLKQQQQPRQFTNLMSNTNMSLINHINTKPLSSPLCGSCLQEVQWHILRPPTVHSRVNVNEPIHLTFPPDPDLSYHGSDTCGNDIQLDKNRGRIPLPKSSSILRNKYIHDGDEDEDGHHEGGDNTSSGMIGPEPLLPSNSRNPSLSHLLNGRRRRNGHNNEDEDDNNDDNGNGNGLHHSRRGRYGNEGNSEDDNDVNGHEGEGHPGIFRRHHRHGPGDESDSGEDNHRGSRRGGGNSLRGRKYCRSGHHHHHHHHHGDSSSDSGDESRGGRYGRNGRGGKSSGSGVRDIDQDISRCLNSNISFSHVHVNDPKLDDLPVLDRCNQVPPVPKDRN